MGPRKVFMNKEPWKMLNHTDQVQWDGINESGKRAILAYVENESNRTDQDSKNTQCSINIHEWYLKMMMKRVLVRKKVCTKRTWSRCRDLLP